MTSLGTKIAENLTLQIGGDKLRADIEEIDVQGNSVKLLINNHDDKLIIDISYDIMNSQHLMVGDLVELSNLSTGFDTETMKVNIKANKIHKIQSILHENDLYQNYLTIRSNIKKYPKKIKSFSEFISRIGIVYQIGDPNLEMFINKMRMKQFYGRISTIKMSDDEKMFKDQFKQHLSPIFKGQVKYNVLIFYCSKGGFFDLAKYYNQDVLDTIAQLSDITTTISLINNHYTYSLTEYVTDRVYHSEDILINEIGQIQNDFKYRLTELCKNVDHSIKNIVQDYRVNFEKQKNLLRILEPKISSYRKEDYHERKKKKTIVKDMDGNSSDEFEAEIKSSVESPKKEMTVEEKTKEKIIEIFSIIKDIIHKKRLEVITKPFPNDIYVLDVNQEVTDDYNNIHYIYFSKNRNLVKVNIEQPKMEPKYEEDIPFASIVEEDVMSITHDDSVVEPTNK
jgi:hypothetical protein